VPQTITIVRPPLVLVHGLWSNSVGAWERPNRRLAGIQERSGDDDPGPDDRICDYASTNAAHFSANNTVVASRIGSVLASYGAKGLAAARADVVGHSMGGILARRWTQNNQYTNDATNYRLGNIHKLITIDTPHLGAVRADELLDKRATLNAFAQFKLDTTFSVFGKSITAGAIEDLQTSGRSGEIQNMNSAVTRAPIHVIAGNDSAINTCPEVSDLPAALSHFGLSLDTITSPNDTIVTTSSQAPSGFPSDTVHYCHINVNGSIDAINGVKNLLNNSVSSSAFSQPAALH